MTGNDEYRGPNPYPHRSLWQRVRDWWLMRKVGR
jgi:hypothetical protein